MSRPVTTTFCTSRPYEASKIAPIRRVEVAKVRVLQRPANKESEKITAAEAAA